jgi:hypothetical protein
MMAILLLVGLAVTALVIYTAVRIASNVPREEPQQPPMIAASFALAARRAHEIVGATRTFDGESCAAGGR